MTEHQNGLQNKEDLTHSTNKSSSEMDDIDALTENYRLLRSKLKKLIDAVKRHHDAMLQISYDRVEVSLHLPEIRIIIPFVCDMTKIVVLPLQI